MRLRLMTRNGIHDHPDGVYCAMTFRYLKSFACELNNKLRAHAMRVVFIMADDKASSKVGEPGPGTRVALVGRQRPTYGHGPADACAHDFTWAKVHGYGVCMVLVLMHVGVAWCWCYNWCVDAWLLLV